jgi:hypothetical protein
MAVSPGLTAHVSSQEFLLFYQGFARAQAGAYFANRRQPIFAIVAHAQDSALSR